MNDLIRVSLKYIIVLAIEMFARFANLGSMCHIGLYINFMTNKYLSDIKEFEEKSDFLKICHKMYLNDVVIVVV